MLTRKSIRTYKKDQVKDEDLKDIIQAAIHAPTLILVSNAREYPNAMADCSVAIENMMLAAHSLGLSSCWINQLTWFGDIPDIRKLLSGYGVPDDYMVCGSVALGYSENDSGKLVPRKEPNVTIIK